MPRWLESGVKVVLLALFLFACWSAISWVRFRLRPDPARNASPVAFSPRLDPDIADLSSALEAVRAKHKLPALAGAAIRGGKVVALGATGTRKAGGDERVTTDDLFHLGSDTKAMTATLIAVLVERGTLKWETTIGEVFGDVVPAMNPAWKPVTVEQLLRNRGGAPAGLDKDGLWGKLWERRGSPTEQRMQLVEGVLANPPAAEPGSRFIYSNAGFAIAGAMAEKLTGKSWEDLMQAEVFKPLGITSAGFGPPGEPGKADQPWGHRGSKPIDPGQPGADNPPAIGPAGTVHMSMHDWGRFIAAHVRGSPANPHRGPALLKPESYARLHTPDGEYAMGWLTGARDWAKGEAPDARGLVLTHAGSNTMWFCVAWLAPERDLAVIAATNTAGRPAERGADEAIGVLLNAIKDTAR
jgi:CubicO group peptidase (beta-lactamase class C family)